MNEQQKGYTPRPIDTSSVRLDGDVLELLEQLSRHNHDVWARQRLSQGWKYGPRRDDASKESPCLVDYDDLPEQEKDYDRNTATEVLKAIIALGYEVRKRPG